MAQKDHYKTLGVSQTASAEEIKKAFRKMAKKYHPDATGGDKAKEAKFKEINEAYDVLSDTKKREEYDALRANPFAGGFGGGFDPGGFGGTRWRREVNVDINDLFGNMGAGGFADRFSDLFNSPSGGPSGTRSGRTRKSRGADSEATIELTLVEAALGTEKSFSIQTAESTRQVTVRIPAGVNDGETIRVPGQGQPGRGGGPAGDLLLKVMTLPHPTMRRSGADLEVDVPIQIDQAVLGAKIEIPTLEGKALVTIPAGTSSGQKLRLRGKGAGDRKGGRGDLYGVVQIVVPRQVSEEAKELITRFAELTRGQQGPAG